VFQVTPSDDSRHEWTGTVLYSFQGGGDGNGPESGLVAGTDGSLYGTTQLGGNGGTCPEGCGIVFQLQPPGAAGSPWTETILHQFTGGADGFWPDMTPIMGEHETLFGTTQNGGKGRGSVFALSPPSAGGSWTMRTMHAFLNPSRGSQPIAGLVADPRGRFYGVTVFGGAQTCPGGCGVIFSVRQ